MPTPPRQTLKYKRPDTLGHSPYAGHEVASWSCRLHSFSEASYHGPPGNISGGSMKLANGFAREHEARDFSKPFQFPSKYRP